MWNELAGRWVYKAGASGTVTVPKGARLLRVMAAGTSAGTLTIFGGDSLPIPANMPVTIPFLHQMAVSGDNAVTSGSQNLVFASTTMYYVEYMQNLGGPTS